MQAISDWISGASVPDREPDQTSLVADWKSYSATGAPGKTLRHAQSDTVLISAEEGTSSVTKFVSGAFSTVAAAATGAATSVSNSVQK